MPEGGVFWLEDLKRNVVSELTFVSTAYMPVSVVEKVKRVVEEVKQTSEGG